jgi:Carboxypeptidase regulatory-like domain/TonB dependent receptor
MLRNMGLAACFVLAAAGALFAQATATITGRMVDQAGAVLPGVTVTVTNVATGVARDTITNAEGLYNVPALEPAMYNVKAELAGFAPQVRNNVQLLIGATLTIDLQLGLASIQESVTVAGQAPLVETTQAVTSNSITQIEVQALPMLNRSISAMMNLLPGAREVAGTVSAHGFSSSFVSFGGGTGRNFNMLIDGTDNKEDECGGTLMVYSLEGVQEFKTLTTGASAEYGRGSATVLVATKSGGNVFHGTGFFYGRNQNLIATDYFSQPANGGLGKPPFSRQQYGGSIGGPLVKDNAWFFGAVERIPQDFTLPRPQAAFNQLAILQNALPGVGILNSQSVFQPSRDLLHQYKLNFQLGQKHSAWVRWSGERSYIDNGFVGGTGALLSYSPQFVEHNHQITWNMAGGETWVINPTTVNQVSVSYLSYTHDDHYPPCPQPQIQNGVDMGVDACLIGKLAFPSVSTGPFSGGAFALFTDVENKFEVKDDFSKQMGRHAFKTGTSVMLLPLFGGIYGAGSPGTIAFFDDPSVIVNNTNGRYPQGFLTPGIVRSITETSQAIGDYGSAAGSVTYCLDHQTPDCEVNSWRHPDWAVGVYAQDDFKVSQRVTLNLGLRWDAYDYIGTRNLPNNRAFQALNAIGNQFGTGIPKVGYKYFQPRLGAAWDVHGDGKDVVRGSYGLFFVGGIQNAYYVRNQLNQPFIFTSAQIVDTAIGQGPLANYVYGVSPLPAPPLRPTELPPGGRTAGYWYDPNLVDERHHEFHTGWSHVFPHEAVVSVDYTHILGHDGWRQVDVNPIINGNRILAPAFQSVLGDANILSNVYIIRSVDRSLYDEVTAHFERRFSPRAALQANYTLAWARGMGGVTDGTVITSAPYPQTPSATGGDINAPWEWGPTAFDERHRVVVTGLLAVPGGIDVSPSMTFATARPYTQFRAVNPSGNGSLMILDASGNPAGVNNARGVPLFNLNMRVTKNLPIGGERKVSLFAEFYNMTNRANFGNQFFGNAFAPATYGQPSGYLGGVGAVSTLPNSFQVQFGGRFSF